MENLILVVSLLCAMGAPAPAVAAEQSSVVQTKGEYTKKAHKAIDALSVKIDALEAKAKEAGADGRESIDASVKNLKIRRESARKELAKLKRAGLKTWAKLRVGVDKGIRDLEAAYEDAAKE